MERIIGFYHKITLVRLVVTSLAQNVRKNSCSRNHATCEWHRRSCRGSSPDTTSNTRPEPPFHHAKRAGYGSLVQESNISRF